MTNDEQQKILLDDALTTIQALRTIVHELTKEESCEHDADICWCGVRNVLEEADIVLRVHGRL